jgi:catechol 2,3-dioxygenase-like lactoylglutathione lyase family enzyme
LLGHLSFGVRDLAKAKRFYDAVLAELGYVQISAAEGTVGYGLPGTANDRFRLFERAGAAPPGPGFHFAFAAPSSEAVDRFHKAALQCGGTDQGAPGPRPQYGAVYYAAFVLDPDGYKIEAKFPPPSER